MLRCDKSLWCSGGAPHLTFEERNLLMQMITVNSGRGVGRKYWTVVRREYKVISAKEEFIQSTVDRRSVDKSTGRACNYWESTAASVGATSCSRQSPVRSTAQRLYQWLVRIRSTLMDVAWLMHCSHTTRPFHLNNKRLLGWSTKPLEIQRTRTLKDRKAQKAGSGTRPFGDISDYFSAARLPFGYFRFLSELSEKGKKPAKYATETEATSISLEPARINAVPTFWAIVLIAS